jgi:hypothetical protein
LEKYTLAIDGCADAGSVGIDKVESVRWKVCFSATTVPY